MEWEIYEERYRELAIQQGINEHTINENLNYAKRLFESEIPIIYDGIHFSRLVGVTHDYIYKISNSRRSGYRRFEIPKKKSGKRIIHEPLPNLKLIQKWILTEILEKKETSAFAKAYKKTVNIKDNVRFHRGQEIVVKLDIQEFFFNLKEHEVLILFKEMGYTLEVSVLLTKLCTLRGSLPQGAPTSAYLSNLLMCNIDCEISDYCKNHKIRYTRYADDMTFSGAINIGNLIMKVQDILKQNKLTLNHSKTKVMRQHNQQSVTGITVNQKLQVDLRKRRKIRQEVYYIKKYGLENHLNKKNIVLPREFYLKSLIGKVSYIIFVNPKDQEMKDYLLYLKEFI